MHCALRAPINTFIIACGLAAASPVAAVPGNSAQPQTTNGVVSNVSNSIVTNATTAGSTTTTATSGSATPPPPLPAGASIDIDVPAQLSWTPGARIPLAVSTKLAPAPDVSVLVGPFVEASTMKPLQVGFCIAESATADCADKVEIPPNSLRQLWLVGAGSADAGNYAGTIRLAASNGLMNATPLSLRISSGEWQARGFWALVIGVVLSFLMSVWLPNQRARDEGMMPFLQLKPRVQAVIGQLKGGDAAMTKAVSLKGELEPDWLRAHNFIPPLWPAATTVPVSPDALKAQMDSVQKRLAALELLAPAMAQSANAATRKKLDALAADPEFPWADMQAQINGVLGLQAAPGRGDEITPATLVFREEARNLAFWLISSFLAVALGYVMLIEGNPSFGGWKDVATGLLWGLGVATAGTKVADLTVGQVRVALRTPATS